MADKPREFKPPTPPTEQQKTKAEKDASITHTLVDGSILNDLKNHLPSLEEIFQIRQNIDSMRQTADWAEFPPDAPLRHTLDECERILSKIEQQHMTNNFPNRKPSTKK